jgi:hypothetical protein
MIEADRPFAASQIHSRKDVVLDELLLTALKPGEKMEWPQKNRMPLRRDSPQIATRCPCHGCQR